VKGDLANTTGDTTTASEGLTGSFGQLGFGITALTGGAMSLFSAFTSIRDAQLRVEVANNRLDKANTKVDTSMMKLNDTINRLLTDTSLQVTGLGALAEAQNNYNALIEAGVTSGPQYEAALAALRLAQQGLSSSTSEGTELIGKLNVDIDKNTQALGGAHIATVKSQKANEGLIGSFVGIGGGITTVISAVGGLTQTISSGGQALSLFKGGIVDLGIRAFGTAGIIGTIGPVIAALAVPVGLAVLAIGAFVAAITAIRVHIKVFDDMGAAIGHVFPQAVGFLNEFRAAFISTSDAVNSSISYILGGIDALSGGTTKSQSALDAWVQSTFHAGEAGTKVGGVIKSVGPAVDSLTGSIVMQKGTFQEYNGNLKDLENNMIALEGGWFKNAQGAAVVTEAYGQSSTAAAGTAQSQAELNNILGPYVPLAEGAGAATAEQGAATAESAQKNTLLGQALSGNIPALTAVIKGETEAAAASGDMSAGAIEAAGATEGITPAAEGAGASTLSLSESLALAAKSTDPLVAGIAQTIISLRDEEQAAAKTHAGNQLLLSLWGVEMPAAIANDREAIQALVNIHAEENAAVDKSLVAANEMILKYGDMAKATSMTRDEKIAYAQVLEDTVKKQEEEKAALEETIPVQEQVAAKVEELIQKKKEEGVETEATRQFLIQYIAEQHGVVVAVDESIQVLEALEKGLAAVSTAYEEGRASIVSWALELQAAAEHEKGALAEMSGLIEALSVHFPQAASMTSEELQRLTEQVLESGKGWEEYKKTVQEAVDAAAESFTKSSDIMIGALQRVGDNIGGDEWKDDLSEWEDDLDGTLAGMTIAVEEAFGTNIPDILASFAGDADAQFAAVKGYLSELKGQIDMSPEAWDIAFGEIEGILSNAALTTAEKMALIEANIAGLGERATPKLMAGFGVMTDSMRNFLTSNFLPAIEQALASKDPTLALQQYFAALPAATQQSLSFFTGALKAAGGDVEMAITAIVGMLQSQDIAIPPSTIDAMAKAFNVPAETIKAKIAEMATDIKGLPPEVKTAADEVGVNISTVGAAGSAARAQWGLEIVEMANVLRSFTTDTATFTALISTSFQGMAVFSGQELVKLATDITTFVNSYLKPLVTTTQSAAVTVSGAFNNMATNVNTSLVTAARGITTFQGIITNLVRASQSGATTVSEAFNNMATNITTSLNRGRSAVTTFQSAVTTMASQGASRASSFASSFASAMSRVQSSANSARSSVQQLQSAINSLRSKTITITTIHRQVIQRVFAAQGAAAVISTSPTQVGPIRASEFGQRELITVTPLENPSGQTITGPGMQVSTSGPGAKAFAKSGDKSISLGDNNDVVNMLRELVGTNTKGKQSRGNRVVKVVQPQIITLKLEGKELTRFINKNLFELSDSLM
jgi:hypothetical protein